MQQPNEHNPATQQFIIFTATKGKEANLEENDKLKTLVHQPNNGSPTATPKITSSGSTSEEILAEDGSTESLKEES